MTDSSIPTVFFDRARLNRKARPKPIVYQVYICSKCKPPDEAAPADREVGAWCALIVQQPQDNLGAETQTTYMVSGVEESGSHIRIRLSGIKEALAWITANVAPAQYSSVEATLVSNDVFSVNTLREWLPKWSRGGFKMGTKAERDDDSVEHEKRPNSDLLEAIAQVSTKIKLTVKWQVDKGHHMSALSERVDELLAAHVPSTAEEESFQECKA